MRDQGPTLAGGNPEGSEQQHTKRKASQASMSSQSWLHLRHCESLLGTTSSDAAQGLGHPRLYALKPAGLCGIACDNSPPPHNWYFSAQAARHFENVLDWVDIQGCVKVGLGGQGMRQ
eukprot:gene9112-biopygen1644